VLGVPYDMGTEYRSGARFGPRAIREASTVFSFGHGGAHDHEDDAVYLATDDVRIVDVGDADMLHTDTASCHHNTEAAVRKILERGAMLTFLGYIFEARNAGAASSRRARAPLADGTPSDTRETMK
jgi:agmatinase